MRTEQGAFNVWLKQRRKALDLTQEDLAERIGCSTTTIQKLELGQRRPSKQVALRLAECLKIPHDDHDRFVSFARSVLPEPGPTSARPFDVEDVRQTVTSHTSSSSSAPATPTETAHIDSPTNLPQLSAPLLGREDEVAAACRYLLRDDLHLLTVTGAPGIGKTSVGLQVAANLVPYFSDGVFFVELAPISDPTMVASAVAAGVGLAESGGESAQSKLKYFMSGKRVLLFLDNFEQVLDAAPLVVELINSCPGLKILVTSREALHVVGEQQLPLTPLSLPSLTHMPGVEILPDYPAIALFLERARSVDPAFSLNEQNALDVVTVCTRLDGLPLAIELAAARVSLFSVADMAARLDKQLSLLTNPARHRHFAHLPARQQTMRAAIDWSYELLEPHDRQLLFQLGVFVGGFTLEAAEAVCGPDAIDGIESLLGKSLLKRSIVSDETRGQERRFTMLESIREYGLEGLGESNEAEDIRRKHATYFLSLVERAEPHLAGQEQVYWARRLESEHTNIVAAMAWSLARGEEDIALRIGGALRPFWIDHYPREGRWWLEGLPEGSLVGSALEPTLVRARALHAALSVLWRTREYPLCRVMTEECLRVYRALDDERGIARALRLLAHLIFEMNLPGDRELARKLLDESLERWRSMGDSRGMIAALSTMAEAARAERAYPRAIYAFEKCLALSREIGNKRGVAVDELNLAFVLYHCGEYERAKELLRESLYLFRELASPFIFALGLVAWAGIERVLGNPQKAARLVGAANALAAPGGTLFDPNDQRDREEVEAAVRADLSDQEWLNAMQKGRTMGMNEAIAYALEES